MSIMKAFNEVRGNLAAKTIFSALEKRERNFQIKGDYEHIMSELKSLTEDPKIQKAHSTLSDPKNRNDDFGAPVYSLISKFMNNITSSLSEHDGGLTEAQRRDYVEYAIGNKMTAKQYDEMPHTIIYDMNHLSRGFSSEENLDFLSFVESRYPLSNAVSRTTESHDSMALLEGFFRNMTNENDSNDAAIEHLRHSKAFQAACQSKIFMHAIRYNDERALMYAGVSIPTSDREPM